MADILTGLTNSIPIMFLEYYIIFNGNFTKNVRNTLPYFCDDF